LAKKQTDHEIKCKIVDALLRKTKEGKIAWRQDDPGTQPLYCFRAELDTDPKVYVKCIKSTISSGSTAVHIYGLEENREIAHIASALEPECPAVLSLLSFLVAQPNRQGQPLDQVLDTLNQL